MVAALQHTAGYLRRELSHRLKLYTVPELHFFVRRFDRIGPAPVAADRRRRGRRPQAFVLRSDDASHGACASSAAESTACSCSTSHPDSRRTPRCSGRSGSTARRRPAIPERSTRSRPGSFRSASARRPSSRRRCSMRTRPTSRRSASASRRPRATPRARCSRRVRSRCRGEDIEASFHGSSAGSRRCRRATPRSSTKAASTTNTRATASRSCASARSVEIRELSAPLVARAGRRVSRPLQQGHLHPRARRGHRRRARLRRAPGRAAPDRDGRLRPRRRSVARGSGGALRGGARRCPAAGRGSGRRAATAGPRGRRCGPFRPGPVAVASRPCRRPVPHLRRAGLRGSRERFGRGPEPAPFDERAARRATHRGG